MTTRDWRVGTRQPATGFTTGVFDLLKVRERIGRCGNCQGFIEVSRDPQYNFVTATCVICGKEKEVPDA